MHYSVFCSHQGGVIEAYAVLQEDGTYLPRVTITRFLEGDSVKIAPECRPSQSFADYREAARCGLAYGCGLDKHMPEFQGSEPAPLLAVDGSYPPPCVLASACPRGPENTGPATGQGNEALPQPLASS